MATRKIFNPPNAEATRAALEARIFDSVGGPVGVLNLAPMQTPAPTPDAPPAPVPAVAPGLVPPWEGIDNAIKPFPLRLLKSDHLKLEWLTNNIPKMSKQKLIQAALDIHLAKLLEKYPFRELEPD